jgi:outer membrane protein with beta-barrel domain
MLVTKGAAVRIVLLAIVGLLSVAATGGAQTVQWGAKAGINRSSVPRVPDYYDWLLCCHPLFPNAMVDAGSGTGFTAGAFVEIPVRGTFGVQGELMVSRRRHAVDLEPYYSIKATFARDYIEAAGLARFGSPSTGDHQVYVAIGPVVGWRIREDATSNEPSLTRRHSDTDIYVVQTLAYGAPELLRTTQMSVAAVGGWAFRRVVVELRFTQGLQSIFKNQPGLLSAFVALGGHEPTLRRLVPEFGPFLESGKSRDLAVLAGFRF